MVKMKDSIEQDQHVIRELGRYRLASPSPDLHDRVLRAAREALSSSGAGLHWTGRWLRECKTFGQEILAFASALMLILGAVMQLGGGQSALADSLERLTVMATVSGGLHRATSMDCTILRTGAVSESSQYRIRWNKFGITRIDLDSTDGMKQTLWITNETVSMEDENGTIRSLAITSIPSKWHPPMDFLTPIVLAQQIERYGLMQAERRDDTGPDEFLLVGREDHLIIEIAIDAETFLPKTLKKYPPDSARMGKHLDWFEEVRFQWNEAIPEELLSPGLSAVQRPTN